MRKALQQYDQDIPEDDYKMEEILKRDKENFESPDIWFYVGADATNPRFAKVGITMRDLRSRSYSSANPNYYLFCAFQCQHGTSRAKLNSIEKSTLRYLDDIFVAKRACHRESQQLSECYYDIDFEDFFSTLHDYLLDYHGEHFQTRGYGNLGRYALEWLFSSCIQPEEKRRYLNLILRW